MQLVVQSGLLAQQVVPVVGESRAIVVRQENPTISYDNEGPPAISLQTIARQLTTRLRQDATTSVAARLLHMINNLSATDFGRANIQD